MSDDAERICDLYRVHGDVWAGHRAASTFFERPWFERFLSLVRKGGHVLDLGCGSGFPIAQFVVAEGYALTGIDSSDVLLAHARRSLPRGDWRQGDMRVIDLGRTFDGIIAWHSFFHLTGDHQRKMFARFAAHAAPGAPLIFTSGGEEGTAIGSLEGDPLHHASLNPEEYRELLSSAGFEVVDHVTEDQTCGGATIWLARKG